MGGRQQVKTQSDNPETQPIRNNTKTDEENSRTRIKPHLRGGGGGKLPNKGSDPKTLTGKGDEGK